jgi:lysophospholipase L1-like esterase
MKISIKKYGSLRFSPRRALVGVLGAAVVAAVLWAIWAGLGYPLVFKGQRYAYNPEERGDLCPRREPGLRGVPCVLPAIPHLVSLEGFVPPNYRTKRFNYSTNAMIYRGAREYRADKASDVFRVIVLGTGVSFGNGVDDEDVYSHILEKKLNAGGQRTYEVYNMAIPGSTTDVGVKELKRITSQFEFDYLIFCYGVNDGLPMFEKPVERYAGTLMELVHYKKAYDIPMLVAVEPRSSFYPWPYEGYKGKFEEIVTGEPQMNVIDLPAVLDAVEQHHGLRLVREGDVQRVVEYHWGRPRTLFEVEYATEEGDQSVAPAVYEFLDTHRVDQATYIDGVHLSEEGMQVVADELYAFMVAGGLAI